MDNGHLQLSPYCGICEERISRDESCFPTTIQDSITVKHDHFSFQIQARPLLELMVSSADTRTVKDMLLRPSFLTIHHDCHIIFIENCTIKELDTLHHRLWTITAWKNPWRKAPPIYLSDERIDTQNLQVAACLDGLHPLCTLPVELLAMIRTYSTGAFLWRYIFILRVAARASSLRDEASLVVPLGDIVSWERNGTIQLAKLASPSLVTVRVTMDSGGIRKIEWLSHTINYSGECHQSSAFIVRRGDLLLGVTAQIQV
ncbi:hypothetical protein PT974_09993 [Cladobotryum mycophilum]|uniref:Uncharacterized protein n=1 Tax=Cladobotryum mycophilum TaxID=491253 RepID=A0ABR0S8L8_9HYPO